MLLCWKSNKALRNYFAVQLDRGKNLMNIGSIKGLEKYTAEHLRRRLEGEVRNPASNRLAELTQQVMGEVTKGYTRKQATVFLAGDFSAPITKRVLSELILDDCPTTFHFCIAHPTPQTRVDYLATSNEPPLLVKRGLRSCPVYDTMIFHYHLDALVYVNLSATRASDLEVAFGKELAFARSVETEGSDLKVISRTTQILVISNLRLPDQTWLASRSLRHFNPQQIAQGVVVQTIFPPTDKTS
jgi:hypothetical protein